MLTIERLKEVLRYDEESGEFFWIVHRTGTAPVGSQAGSVDYRKDGRGYRRVYFEGRRYLAHRLAWFYVFGVWPTHQIDHRDGNGLNNRISNLREATTCEQNQNRRMCRSNKSGVKGVSWNKSNQRWHAQIEANGVARHLGSYLTKEDAGKAYEQAALKLHGEFARVGV